MTKELQLNRHFFLSSLSKMADLAEAQRNYWTSLDSAIGDGDHGINLSIGFRGVKEQLPLLTKENLPIASLLKKVGFILLGKVGGAAGPLYGSFFIKMGENIGEQHVVSQEEFTEMLVLGLAAIQERGKAQLGDKTLVDALAPGLAYLQSHQATASYVEIFGQSVELMKAGAEKTKPLIAKKGRAMRLGERAIGHLDPGATSMWMLMDIFYQELIEHSQQK